MSAHEPVDAVSHEESDFDSGSLPGFDSGSIAFAVPESSSLTDHALQKFTVTDAHIQPFEDRIYDLLNGFRTTFLSRLECPVRRFFAVDELRVELGVLFEDIERHIISNQERLGADAHLSK